MKSIRFAILLTTLSLTLVIAAPAIVRAEHLTPTIIESDRDEFDDLIRDAIKLYEERKHHEALAKCIKAAALRPNDHRPHIVSGYVYLAQGKMKEASDAFAKAVALDPQNAKFHFLHAHALRMSNARDDAMISVRKAIELDPSFAEAYLLLAGLHGLGKGDRKEQIAAYRKAIELKPGLAEAYRQLAMILSVTGDEKGAEEIHRKSLAMDPKNDTLRFDLGRLLVKLGRLKEARELWEGRTGDKDKTYPNFILLLERAEKREAAKANLAKNPNDPEALLQMGLLVMDGESWVVDGRQERAIEYFKKALAIDPKFAKAQLAIVKAWVEIADTYEKKAIHVDEELAKLKAMDASLVAEAEAYRRAYSGGLKAASPPPPPPKKN